ncbi:hypothetical protein HID58_069543, partial [Brassica napus]
VIDLTLTIADLLVEGTGRWKVNLVRQTFTDEDAELILKLKPHRSRKDSFKWGYAANGCYSSQSGRKLLDLLKEPSSESICHLLFSCPFATEVWDRSGVQLPLNGFSRSYVFLNVYHLIFANGRRSHYTQNKVFPWVLWQIWKTRNALFFEKVQASSCTAATKALEEADEWFDIIHFGYLLEKIIHALPFLYPCSLEYVEGARNNVAEKIAVSVTRDHRCQSYVASGGPRWLLNRLESEARRACT